MGQLQRRAVAISGELDGVNAGYKGKCLDESVCTAIHEKNVPLVTIVAGQTTSV